MVTNVLTLLGLGTVDLLVNLLLLFLPLLLLLHLIGLSLLLL